MTDELEEECKSQAKIVSPYHEELENIKKEIEVNYI